MQERSSPLTFFTRFLISLGCWWKIGCLTNRLIYNSYYYRYPHFSLKTPRMFVWLKICGRIPVTKVTGWYLKWLNNKDARSIIRHSLTLVPHSFPRIRFLIHLSISRARLLTWQQNKTSTESNLTNGISHETNREARLDASESLSGILTLFFTWRPSMRLLGR